MPDLGAVLLDIWVVPEFCATLAALLAGFGAGLALKGLYHRRRLVRLRRLAGLGNDPRRPDSDIPRAMLLGKRLWNPAVHLSAAACLLALALVVFWPGLGRTDYPRLGDFHCLALVLGGFLLPLCLTLLLAPVGGLPLLVFAGLLLVIQQADQSQDWAPLWQTRQLGDGRLEPAGNPFLCAAEYAKVAGDGYWVVSPLSEQMRRLFARSPSPLRRLVRADAPELAVTISLRQTEAWLRPFSAPLHLQVDLPGDAAPGAEPVVLAGLALPLDQWWPVVQKKRLQLEKRLLRHHGHVVYLDGSTEFRDLRDLAGQ